MELVAHDEVQDFIKETNRIPRRVYGAKSGRWVNHPETGKLTHWSDLTDEEQAAYTQKQGGPSTRTWIMKDSDPFVSPIDGSVVGGRAQRRDHMLRHDAIDAGDVNFDEEQVHGYKPPTQREIEEDIRIGWQKAEAGYYQNNPDADDPDAELKWNTTDQNLRRGGYE